MGITVVVLIVAALLLMAITKSYFIPGIVLVIAALLLITWSAIKTIRQKEIKKIIDIKLFAPFLLHYFS